MLLFALDAIVNHVVIVSCSIASPWIHSCIIHVIFNLRRRYYMGLSHFNSLPYFRSRIIDIFCDLYVPIASPLIHSCIIHVILYLRRRYFMRLSPFHSLPSYLSRIIDTFCDLYFPFLHQ